MNIRTTTPQETVTGHIVGPAEALMAHLLDHALEHEMGYRALGNGFEVEYDGSTARVALEGDRAVLRLAASDAATLYVMQEMVVHLLEGSEGLAVWDEVRQEGVMPPNLRLVQVVSVRQISPGFRRVRVAGDIGRFDGTRIHFRLLLPPKGLEPQWPRVDATGRARWPEGEHKLHNPVYTVRDIDIAAGWVEFDVFLHEGGRTSDWTETVQPGDTVGIIGPGGSHMPLADWVALFADETGLPAMARALAALPAGTTGTATVRLANAADRQELAHPPGVTLTWLTRDDRTGLLEALDQMVLPEAAAGSRYVWFVAEEAEADAARARLRALGLDRTEMQAAAYWTA